MMNRLVVISSWCCSSASFFSLERFQGSGGTRARDTTPDFRVGML